MALSSLLQRLRRAPADAPATQGDGDAVRAARQRARRRLIGVLVLLLAGVIGFPLLFETQPRPVSVDVPIVIPPRDGAAAPVLSSAPAAQTSPAAASSDGAAAARETIEPARAAAEPAGTASIAASPLADGAAQAVTEPAAARQAAEAKAAAEQVAAQRAAADKAAADKAAADRAAAEKATAARAAAEKAAAEKAAAARTAADPAAPDKAAAKPPARDTASEAARARALLEGQSEAKAAAARVVVQVGAYADDAQVVKVRQKLQSMGYKTYTQVVTVQGQRTTRVRVGPFEERKQADEVASRVKAAGLPAAVLAL